jgi:hypothetical protein
MTEELQEPEREDFWNVSVNPQKENCWTPIRSFADIVRGKSPLKPAKAILMGIYRYIKVYESRLYAYFQLEDGTIVVIEICEGPFGPGAFIAMFLQYFAHYPTPKGAPLKFSGMPINTRDYDNSDIKSHITIHDVVMQIELYTTKDKKLHLLYTVKNSTSGELLFKLDQEQTQSESELDYLNEQIGYMDHEPTEATNVFTVKFTDTYDSEHEWLCIWKSSYF